MMTSLVLTAYLRTLRMRVESYLSTRAISDL